ncbi:hypothetical protein ACFTAO_41395 [Paenibacillus rhizoplanae]
MVVLEVGWMGGIKGINPIGGAGSGLDEEMKGINPISGAGSGVNEEMKGINPVGDAEKVGWMGK